MQALDFLIKLCHRINFFLWQLLSLFFSFKLYKLVINLILNQSIYIVFLNNKLDTDITYFYEIPNLLSF